MKSAPFCAAVVVALAFNLGIPVAARGASEPAPATPAAQPPPAPKSVFTFDPKTIKDPFFPKTRRFAALNVKTNEAELPPAPLFPEEIHCKGISGTPTRPLAIINNKTVEKGERFDLFINGQRVRVNCINIMDKRVVLEINGVTKELKLRTTFQ